MVNHVRGLWLPLQRAAPLEGSYLGFKTEPPSGEDEPSVQGCLLSTLASRKVVLHTETTQGVSMRPEKLIVLRSAAFPICTQTGMTRIKTQKMSLVGHLCLQCHVAEMKSLKVHLLVCLAIRNHELHCLS